MIEEFKNSVSSILYERVSSPLFGALFISWCLWNWKIIYITLFISESRLEVTKIDFITTNLSNIHHIVTYPIISTLLLLTVIPFFTNGAYWLHLKFYKWRHEKKHKVEMKKLLTLEQSINLREQIAKKETAFENLLSAKENEIQQLKIEMEEVLKASSKNKPFKIENSFNIVNSDDVKILVEKISSNDELLKAMESIAEYIQKGLKVSRAASSNVVGYYETNNIIRNKGSGIYEFTDLGTAVYKSILNKDYG